MMTRALFIETASGTVTSDSWAGDSWAGDSWAGDSRAGGTGTSKGTLGAGVGCAVSRRRRRGDGACGGAAG